MAVSLKMPFVDAVVDDSLKQTYVNGEKIGYEFQIRLSNYRGHYLSCIEELSFTVDGNKIDATNFTFTLNDKEFTVSQLPNLISEFWRVTDAATIKVYTPGGVEPGEHHISLTLMLRIPYMPIPGNAEGLNYALLDACGSKTLTVKE
ncbi:DUF6379 domain-containing protein [Gracilibacillus sp. YIM 98692]|uniref:C-glycoside deglycosidase beta subunit domain-containing protein n=1 Tax=Gracilibacillus sp. YIM 98692 TaxID=2663532 RepID=UPI0013CFD8C3|nr:DUF6379 domain-containing protein [Gracilibacillus sp. YIM 98692]